MTIYSATPGGPAPGGSADCVPSPLRVVGLTSGSGELRSVLCNRRKTGSAARDALNPEAEKLPRTANGREATVT